MAHALCFYCSTNWEHLDYYWTFVDDICHLTVIELADVVLVVHVLDCVTLAPHMDGHVDMVPK